MIAVVLFSLLYYFVLISVENLFYLYVDLLLGLHQLLVDILVEAVYVPQELLLLYAKFTFFLLYSSRLTI